MFVRRRDPRYTMSQSALNPEAFRAAEAARIKADLHLAAKERAEEREKAAAAYKAQSWQNDHSADAAVAQWAERGDDDDDSEEEEMDDEETWCPACNKGYRSGGAWENHERSRKHIKNVDR